jgi:phytoene dehydrogenase-like protein
VDSAQIIDEQRARAVSRRDFLRVTGAGGALLAAAPAAMAAKTSGSSARAVIVGAGLAGLTCAHRLRQAGVTATVYEANTRLGGRCWSNRTDFAAGQIAEHGGELIDQGHTRARNLAQEIRLPLDNLLAAEVNGTEADFYFNGTNYPYTQATDDLKAIWQVIHRDLIAIRRNPSGTLTATFQQGTHTFDVTADKLVLALPFSILNSAVDLTRANFGTTKMIAIRELAHLDRRRGISRRRHRDWRTRRLGSRHRPRSLTA